MTTDSRQPLHPEITVTFSGADGNAFGLIASVVTALRRAGVSREEQEKYQAEAESGDYDNVIQTSMRWVHIN